MKGRIIEGEPGTEEAAETEPAESAGSARPRPQSLMLAFLGRFVLGKDLRVFSGSFIDVFARLGVSEQAVRSTLSRMAHRGMLDRRRNGRRVYFGLTSRAVDVLTDGERRIWDAGVVNLDEDDMWTLLSFSLPEAWQRQRHDLRSRLTWSGFGPLRSGLWIAPSVVDTSAFVAELGLTDHVHVFHARLGAPTEAAQVVNEAYDVDELAEGYRRFLDRWDTAEPAPEAPDDLARLLLLTSEWMRLIRADPRLPLAYLPDPWPAVPAQALVHDLHRRYERSATRIVEEAVDTLPAD
jgi:phenylacetic acid degradation operon negative regulatory protein